MTSTPDEYFADLISNVSHANGVFRITFAQQHIDNEVRPAVRLLVPANQLQSMIKAIAGAATEIRDKVAAQAEAASDEKPTAKKKPAGKKK
ncbi:MAG: hypothetical protein HQ483_17930 [Rhodospirillales bacterium]|nr:hypothetical protein [Rhodospirillales bacterium]